jgi:hypothetical protein
VIYTSTCGSVSTTITIPQSGTHPATVQTVYPTPPSTCNNVGYQYAIYTPLPWQNSDFKFTNLQVPWFKTTTPNFTGSTQDIFVSTPFAPTSTTIYGSGPFNTSSFAIQHRTYFYARQSGTYEFYNLLVDDAAWLWIGSSAYSGYQKTNEVLYNYVHAGAKNATYTFTAGNYYPIRLLFANGQETGFLKFNITAPNGEIL